MKNRFQIAVFILSLIGILLLIFITQSTRQTQTGVIKSIHTYNNRIVIQLKNSPEELIVFTNNPINLKNGDTIKFQGRQELYKNKKQIIINKIFLINKTT